jgi:hypothetical protein
MSMSLLKRVASITWIGSTVLMGTAMSAAYWHRTHAGPERPRNASPTRIANLKTGDEILLVFIGGSFCNGTKQPGLKEAVAQLNSDLRERVRAQGKTFVSVGVAMDWSVAEGVDFLLSFGQFDELVVGRNWLNSAVVRYVWRDTPGSAALPQLVVVTRHVNVGGSIIDVGSERLLTRKLGADEIIAWARQGGML